MGSRVTGRVLSRTPRPRCGRPCCPRPITRPRAPISARSCASPASRKQPKRCCAGRSRASPRTPGRGSTSRPISCRRSAPARRWRCSTRHSAPAGPRVARHWSCRNRWRCSSLVGPSRQRRCSTRLLQLGPVPPELAPLWHLAARPAGGGRGRSGAAPAHAAEAMEAGARSHGAARPCREHRIMAHYDLAKFWSGQGEHRARLCALGGGPQAAWPEPAVFARRHIAPSSRPTSRLSAWRASPRHRAPRNHDPAPVFIVGMPRSGHDAGRADSRRRIATCMAQASARRSAARSATLGGGGRRRRCGAPHRGARCRNARRRCRTYLAELHALAPDKGRIIDKIAGQLPLSRPGRADAARREDHPLRARSARHRPVDLHLPLSRRSMAMPTISPTSAGTIAQQDRLMAHWRAALPNPILTVALADWVEDFDGHARPRARPSRPAARPELRPLLRKRQPRAHGQPRASAPAGQRARPRPLANLRAGTRAADRRTGKDRMASTSKCFGNLGKGETSRFGPARQVWRVASGFCPMFLELSRRERLRSSLCCFAWRPSARSSSRAVCDLLTSSRCAVLTLAGCGTFCRQTSNHRFKSSMFERWRDRGDGNGSGGPGRIARHSLSALAPTT